MTPLHYAEQIAYSSKAVLHFSYEMAKRFKDSPGCYVEAGVAAGAQIIAMAYGAPNKTIYAFDSFDGIPWPSNRDDQMPGIKMLTHVEINKLPNPGEQALISSGATVVSMEDFLDHLNKANIDSSNVLPHKGWFENTVIGFDKDISLLRLDGDLYNSTWVCLQHLFPKLLKGCVCIIDDWTLQGCQDACKEYFELIGYEPDYKFLDGTAYFFK